ncbi:MAG: type I-B CRISPR-associated endonuclease Cas1b [Acidobacteriota bacterium]
MPRNYFLTRSGSLRRKDNTLVFEPSPEKDAPCEPLAGVEEVFYSDDEPSAPTADASGSFAPPSPLEAPDAALTQAAGAPSLSADDLGELALEPPAMDEATLLDTRSEASVKVNDRRVIPVEDVESIWVFRELDLNARVLVFLSQHHVPVHFFNYYGFYAGSFYPRDYLQAGYMIVRQVRHYSNRRLRLAIAREFIAAALHNITRNLRYYGARGIDLQAETEGVQLESLRLPEVKSIGELMACEGRARHAYYQGFAKILRDRVEFTKRARRPPDNPVNALISFTNGLVYTAVLSQIYRTQLDPTISFLHEPGARRFSLALDLAEVFKPLLADRLIFKLINQRQLHERDFAQDLNCCYLKDSGRKLILQEWDNRLQKTIEHRRLKRHVSYERLIRLECYKLVKHLTNDEPYKGFCAWW